MLAEFNHNHSEIILIFNKKYEIKQKTEKMFP